MTELDPRDAALQAHTPTVIAPLFGDLEPLQENGHRYIVARDGLWQEVLRPWIWLQHRVATSEVPLPYGLMSSEMEHWLDIDDINNLIRQFIDLAGLAYPNECAAIGVYSEHDQSTELRVCTPESAGRGHIKYTRPTLHAGEHVAVDLHSHGEFPAFFSPQDDEDDAGEVKLSIVIGCVDKLRDLSPAQYMRLYSEARWCLLSHFVGAPYMVTL